MAALVGFARAEIYRWVDERGSTHFADNLHSVPPQYHAQLRALDDRLPPAPQPHLIPLESAAQGFVVGATVNDQATVRLVLDTGATSTVLAPRVVQSLGIPIRTDPPVQVHTANGVVEAGWAEGVVIAVGGRRSAPLQVIVHDAVPGTDGLLGMNYLGAYRVEIRAAGPHLLLSAP
ncbi:MAG: aspartyl protease family protein [Deferrisomatales bacterium]|nr:aspartyl protease family protein [Deferrisomatales bacterium]